MALKRVVVVLALFLSLVVETVGIAEESFFNWGSCLRWRITGICRIVCHRGHCHVWVRVRHWRPDEVAETVNVPGDTIWGQSFPGITASILGVPSGSGPSQAVNTPSSMGGGGVRTATGPLIDEKFFESHVFGVPWSMMVTEQPFLNRWGCRGGKAGLIYASEQDSLWHNDQRDRGRDARSSMVGNWGPLYPRQGRAFHGSDVVASALLSCRAMDLTAGIGGKQIQLGYPTKTACMNPGADPRGWDYNRGRPGTGGKYLWVYWKPVSCCIQVR